MTVTPTPAAPATLATLAADLATGHSSSRSLLETCLARIDDSAGEGHRTFLHVDRDAARAQADTVDALRASGAAMPATAGIPISIKDLFDVAGQVTRAGSTVLSDRAPATVDALSVARLRQAGFVLIGRTNMTEFAFSGLGLNPHYGTPRNPWQRTEGRVPGGSSSGAAVSVADGMAHAALGTDTGGSCRIPAAFTGLVGYKPTARRVPQQGMVPLSPSLDSIGPIARSVACCALLDALLADEPALELHDCSLSGRHFAVPRTLVLGDMDRHVAGAFETALSRMCTAGARIDEIDVPEFAELAAIHARGTLSNAESFAWHRELLARHAAEYDPRVRARIEIGATQTAADYATLLAARSTFIAKVSRRIAGFHAMVMPTVPVVPPRIADLQADDAYFRTNALVLRNPSVVNFLDGCAISIPMHEIGQPPCGLTLACSGDLDRQLFSCAAAAERVVARQ
ncbi:MAG TPA: amidase [Steroidobacteraceae bacterium]|jgi:aspartyl-tRNA(Asn)/glutamyl-tRNA(Gln) amidotransferase subunit A|nr:amidase [Steroidobacteraceae bacterium]